MWQRPGATRETNLRELLLRLAATRGPMAVAAIEALSRLDDGTYGICSECDETIPEARLRVAPEATRCVDCQSESEQRSAA